MKELSIEEKAIAYDEAIEYGRYLINECCKEGTNGSFHRADLDKMFPELKESEDEIIRKDIIKFLIDVNNGVYTKSELEIASWIAWLEKQGEQKPAFEMKSAEESLDIDSDTYNKIVDDCVYDEQKPVDKAEPKFRNGQWIVWQDKCYKVNYNGCGYELVDQNGLSTSLEYGTIDKNAHLWTIQDAKDGDVLYNKDDFAGNSVFIYKGISDKTHAFLYYTRLFRDKNFSIYNDVMWENGAGVNGGEFYPAKKEQRDQLYKAMHEAGYEWDEKALELKKIEQKPANTDLNDIVDKEANAIWKEINTGGSHSIIDSFNQLYGICMQVAEAVVDCKKPAEWIQELESKLSNATPEQLAEWKEKYFKVEPVWSEDDETVLDNLIYALANWK